MADGGDLEATLQLVDYRRRVSAIYGEVRRRGVGPKTWAWWSRSRNDLLSTHPQSAVVTAEDPTIRPAHYFDYDETWRVAGTVVPAEPDPGAAPPSEGDSTFSRIGSVEFVRAGTSYELGLFWLDAYGGGLFLPFGDETNGHETYGGGRYLLDGAKSADLGSHGSLQLVLDFNFAYHPSCAWDPQWACPLAPPSNRLATRVEAGECQPSYRPPTAA